MSENSSFKLIVHHGSGKRHSNLAILHPKLADASSHANIAMPFLNSSVADPDTIGSASFLEAGSGSASK